MVGRRAACGGAAFSDHKVAATRLDVVVCDVAAVGGLVPEGVAVDGLPASLARELDVDALGVGLDDLVAGAGAGAAVDAVGFDGVGGDGRDGRRQEKGNVGELHGGRGGGYEMRELREMYEMLL